MSFKQWCAGIIVGVATSAASASASLWVDVNPKFVQSSGARDIVPSRERVMSLNKAGLEVMLANAPTESKVAVPESAFELDLPLPEGGFARFRVVETAVMAPELAAKFPSIKTYLGQRVDQPSTTARFDITNRGLRAQVIANTHTSYIEPYQNGDVQHYSVFNTADYTPDREPLRCSVTGSEVKSRSNLLSKNDVTMLASGANLRTYRLAVATTGEYTAAYGGTKSDGLSGIVTTINRVNGIYEREISVRMQLVANNDLVIFTNAATDPYTNSNSFAMLSQNQTTLTNIIGTANFDIGHVFTTGGGGVATLQSVCSASAKGRGVTGLPTPRGDRFDVDFVSHELGHQFGATHTFNSESNNCGNDNREPDTAYEVGGGTTIMSYGGSCDPHSTVDVSYPYFHRESLNQMIAFSTNVSSGASCGVLTSTGNTPPAISTGAAFTIPRSTPFRLTAIGSDVNSDTITYTWEQFDLGSPTVGTSLAGVTDGPVFRNFAPTTSPTRLFPSLRYILNNANVVPDVAPHEGTTSPDYFAGERLPESARTLNFRVTARDNRIGGGGTNDAATVVTVSGAAGPFAITSPNTPSINWASGSAQTVSWDVASTNAAPINTSTVEVALSVDGGNSFPFVLASNAPNNGSYNFNVPTNIPNTIRARVRVSAVGNIFFDINNYDFTISGATNAAPALNVTGSVTVTQGGASVTNAVASVTDAPQAASSVNVSVVDVPLGLTVTASNTNGNISLTATAACSVYAASQYPVSLVATNSSGVSTTRSVNVFVNSNSIPSIGSYANQIITVGQTATVIPSAAIADANNNLVSRLVTPTSLPGSGAGIDVSVASNGTVTIETDANTTVGSYPIRVEAVDSCGARRFRDFTAQVVPPGPYVQFVSSALPNGNGIIERGECNALNVALENIGNAAATAVTATLWSATPGVLVTQPTVAVPNIASTQTQSTTTPFQISTSNAFACGTAADFTLVVTHVGANSPRSFPLSFPTGTTSPVFSESFDAPALTAPALPAGWTTQQTGATPPALWGTTTTSPDTPPKVAFTNGVATVASNSLITPDIVLPAAGTGATISIRHAWNFETNYDGGVLELSTNNGTTFNDVTSVAVGGTFTNSGYNSTINANFSSPIAGRPAWSGTQSGYITTVLQLPTSLNGQTIRLRFRAGWDSEVALTNPNWRVDGISVASGRACINPGLGACVAPALLNVDDSSAPDVYAAATDGMLILRYLFGLRDEALTAASGTNPQRSATQIATFINTNLARYDVDGDGEVRATTDGVMIVRRLLGLSGAALTANARVGVRTDNEIANAIDALRP
jgi:hypothetical protein